MPEKEGKDEGADEDAEKAVWDLATIAMQPHANRLGGELFVVCRHSSQIVVMQK